MPDPLIEIAVEEKTRADRDELLRALALIGREDASLRVKTDFESGQTIVAGMSEEHLAGVVDRIRSEFRIDALIGAPQVAYRETITRPVRIDHTHKKQVGVSGQFARVKMHLEPLPRDSRVIFESKIVGDTVPKEYIPCVEKGVLGALDNGVLAGFPVIDLKVTFVYGTYHEADSSALAFEIAARAAMKEGLAKASPKLLEPIMKLEVATPRNYMRDVISDLNGGRRCRITGQDHRGDSEVINAVVPLANMFGYAKNLAALMSNRGTFTMVFSHYAPVPLPPPDDRPFPPAVGMRVA